MKSLLLVSAPAICGAAHAQKVQRSFSSDISVAHDTIEAGSPVVVKVELKNISDHDISSMALPEGDVHAELVGSRPIVRDALGREPPLTKWGRKVFAYTPLSLISVIPSWMT